MFISTHRTGLLSGLRSIPSGLSHPSSHIPKMICFLMALGWIVSGFGSSAKPIQDFLLHGAPGASPQDSSGTLPAFSSSVQRNPNEAIGFALQVPLCPSEEDLVVLDGETCTLNPGTHTFDSITIQSGGTILLEGDPTTNSGVTIEAGTITIEAGGTLSADGQGFPIGQGPGTGGVEYYRTGGGGHGGKGGQGARTGATGGDAYGSYLQPTTLGSGAGNLTDSGVGGGAIHLIVSDALVIDGSLTANGDPATHTERGGGAGGSIWIETNALSGGGSIQANGGNGGKEGGGGGGGRIAIYIDNNSFSGSVHAYGGTGYQIAGPGTIFWVTENRLLIDNAGNHGRAAVLPEDHYTFDTIDLFNAGFLEVQGVNSVLNLDNNTVVGDGTGTLKSSGDINTPAAYTINAFTLDVAGRLTAADEIILSTGGILTLYADSPFYNGGYTFTSILVENGGTLKLVPYISGSSESENDHGVTLILDAITIETGGLVTTSSLGYGRGKGPGSGGVDDYRTGGGGHGGKGGQGARTGATGGDAYGSYLQPTTLGSGAGNLADSGLGGGAIHLIVNNTLSIEGSLTANGNPSTHTERGGGAGGSIWIEANTLSGEGSIQANGGNGGNEGGGGAGGRIAIDTADNTFTGDVQSFGGTGYQVAGAGTVYWASEKRLVVDNHGNAGQAATLEAGDHVFDLIQLNGYGNLDVREPTSTLTCPTVIGDGTAKLAVFGTYLAPETLTIDGYHLDNLGLLSGVDQLILKNHATVTLRASTSLHSGPHIFNSITLQDESVLKLKSIENGDEDYTNDAPFQLEVQALSVGSGSRITADGFGYPGGYEVGKGPGGGEGTENWLGYEKGGGGGYGGKGGDTDQHLGGQPYGDLHQPLDLGSGGGGGLVVTTKYYGGNGGGAIRLIVNNTLHLDGEISADGLLGPGYCCPANGGAGGGSGGSIWITSPTITGSGTIHADGGRSHYGGGGGGGRISIDTESFDPNLRFSYAGGSGKPSGDAGSLYLGELDPGQSTVTVDPATVPTNGISQGAIIVTARNADGIPLPGVHVEAALASGDDALINGQLVTLDEFVTIGTTDSNGMATANIRAETTGTRTVQAKGEQIIITERGTVEFIPGPVDVTQSFVDASPLVRPADGTTPATITVTARDRFGNPIPGLPVEIFATGDAVVSQPTSPTGSDGRTTGSVVNTTAEEVTITATVDGQLINDQAMVTFLGADLSIAKSGQAPSNYGGLSSTHALTGGTITYTIEVSNEGVLDAADVEVTDMLPAGLSFTSEDNGYPFQANGQTLTWQVGSIPVSEAVSLTFEADIASDVLGIVTNPVTAVTSTTESDLADNNAALDTIVEPPRSVMAVSPSSPTMTVLKGDASDLTATIRNTGAALMTGVAATPPPNIPWVSVDPTSIGDIEPLDEATFTVHAAPPPDLTSGYYRDFVTVMDGFGNTGRIALSVSVSAARRDLHVTVENDQGDLIQGASFTLVRQDESVVVTEGTVETYHESAQRTTPASGLVTFTDFEIGAYNYTVIAADHASASGVLTVIEGAGVQEVTLTLDALGRIGLSPSAPVLGVVRGQTNSTTVSLTNLGVGPLTGLSIAPPENIPFVTLALPDPMPILQPGQSMQFSILASPPEDQTGDIFQATISAAADGDLSGQLALTVQLASDAVRDAEVDVVDIQNQPVTGGGSVTLVQQKLTTLIENGETRTYNQRFTGQLDSSGLVSFLGLEPGAYNFIVAATGYSKETDEIVIQPGTGVQVEKVTTRVDPFSYSWTVVPIEQGYDITLTMTFDITTPDPVLTLPEVCWALDGGQTTETIEVFNPSDLPLSIESLSASLPGASIQIGSLPLVIDAQQLVNIPVTVTKTGSLGTGSIEVAYAWDAAPDTFVTYTFNPSSHTSPLIFPSTTYTKDFQITPVVFDPTTTYTLEIGQPSNLDWISLVADPSTPMAWTSSTVINVSLTAEVPDFLVEGVYNDSAPITVTGNDGSFREGSLDISVTQTADGMYLHTNFTLGDVPTVHRQATAWGTIRSGECVPWDWSAVAGPQPKLIGNSSGSSASFPDVGSPVYDFGHQQVRLELSQKVMLEGEAFQADLDITNTSAVPIEDISVDIRLTDLDGVDKSWGFDLIPNTPTDLGTIAVSNSASQTWFIQPTDLGITSPDGEVYLASAAITYTSGGTTYTVTTVPERITVYPTPDLVITYQIPLPTIPCTVFPLKVTIVNRGEGPARNLRFSTAQPQLVDPISGLPISFTIIGTSVNGEPVENGLNLPLGDLPAGESAVIVWLLESNIPGRFVEFTSDYRQSNYLDVPLSPLISEINTYLVPGACAGVPDWAVVSGASECSGAAYQGTYAVAGDTDNHTASDPINTRTGGLSYQVSDMLFSTLAGTLNFERWYASPTTDDYTVELGYGWTHSLDTRLYFPDDPQGQEGAILLKLHSANRYEFDIQSDDTYTAYPGMCGTLTRDDEPATTYTFVDTAQQVYTFDGAGRLQTLSDPTGHLLHYVYDEDGRLSQVHDDGERFISFTYDAQGRIEEVIDHSSRQASYTYDPTSGDLTAATDVLGGTWTYEYDDAHRLTRIIDPTGSIVERTEYDEQGRVFRQFDGQGQLVVQLDYNADGSTTVTDVHGNQQTYRYDERGELMDQTDSLGSLMGRTYDGNFRPSSFTDPAGNTTQFGWSDNGANLLQVTDASGGTTHLGYDDLNNLTEVIDPTGGTSTFSYDGTLLTSLTDALENITFYAYTDTSDAPTPTGLLETITDPLGNTTSFTYDALGQRTSMTDALGHTTTYVYDDLGRLVEITDTLGRTTHRDYDTAGRLTRLVRNYDPLRAQNEDTQWNITTEFVYDAVGNMVETMDTLGRTTHYAYDETNHLVAVTDPTGNRTEFELDESGNLVQTTDPLGRITRYKYDALNRVVKVIDPMGGETHTAYDNRGNVSSSTDANGNTTWFEYDELNRPIDMTDALGGRTTTEYDALGNVLARTDPAGRRTTYAYDAISRLIRQTDPEGGVTQIFYDAAGNRIRTIDPNGSETRYEYDSLNRLVRMIDALGGETEYVYDAVGNQITSTDANDHTTSYSYDLLNRMVEVQDPLGNASRTEYDALGNVLATLDALGNQTSYVYDVLNRLIEQTDPLGGRTSYSYDAVGNQLSFTDANDHTTATIYDELNRPVETHDPDGQVNQTAYDPVGNVLTLTDGLGQTTTFAYDALYRQVSTTDPLGNVTQYTYDQAGNRIGMTNAEGVVTRYEYDGRSSLTAVIENYRPGFVPDSQTNVRTEYSYDANGNRVSILDADGHATSFDYDLLSRMVEERDALGNTTLYSYDPVGNRVSLTDAMGFETAYVYDELNRLIGIDYPEADPDVQFSYDAVGNRKQMVDGVGTSTWTYDTLHRPTAVTDPFGDTVSYAYDAIGNRTQLTYPDGKSVSYSYDASDRMIQVADWDSLVTSYSYDLANRLIETALPNGVISSYDYDAAGRILEIEHRTASDLLSSFNYSYDAVGNRTQAVETMSWPGAPQPVAYNVQSIPMAQTPVALSGSTIPVDPLTAGLSPIGLVLFIPWMRRRKPGHPHLLSALVIIAGVSLALAACSFPIPTLPPIPTRTPTSTPSPTPSDTPTPTPEPVVVTTTTIDYTYDPLYRLTAADYSSGEFFHFTYDAVGNRLTQDTHLASNVYSYDEANRLTSVDDVLYSWDANGDLLSDGYRTYTYDHAGRLSSVVLGADTYEFNYNGLGDRLQQIVNGVVSDYTLDIEAGLAQVLSDGEEAFLYGVGRIAQQGPSSRNYFLGDVLNSTRQLVDDAGWIMLGRAYEPFGDLLLVAGELETSYGFAGEWTDATGLIHLRARYYQPTDGRFVQPDPFAGTPTQPISQNPYPYAYDSPLVYTDASGRNPLLATIITGAALGGIIGTVGGYVFARLIYNWSYRGECNCEMQQWALSVNGTKWIAKTTLLAGAIGFIAGGLAVAAPIGKIVVGLVGYAYSTYDLSVLMTKVYTRWQATSEFGFTRCELLRFVVDVVGIIGGALLASKGFIDLQQSGIPPGYNPLDDLGLPRGFVKNARTFISYTQEIERLMIADPHVILTTQQADELVAMARLYSVDVGLDLGHPGTRWPGPHLHFSQLRARTHVRVEAGYTLPP